MSLDLDIHDFKDLRFAAKCGYGFGLPFSALLAAWPVGSLVVAWYAACGTAHLTANFYIRQAKIDDEQATVNSKLKHVEKMLNTLTAKPE